VLEAALGFRHAGSRRTYETVFLLRGLGNGLEWGIGGEAHFVLERMFFRKKHPQIRALLIGGETE
jgi:hypothetical protein